MIEDRLIKHSRADQRENPYVLEKWIQGNCVKAKSHDEIRKILSNKKEKIEKILEE
ncbi:MAG: hypothetical protein PHV17_06500 [Candidatus Omnitrophica bacterium]|jgi:hypothetical protein|nr:hypothetical protein [Candidatus Omnitrophota bacterium]MDD5070362.1 hypothetical protein [Candidatus Omnitrophota bacterium]